MRISEDSKQRMITAALAAKLELSAGAGLVGMIGLWPTRAGVRIAGSFGGEVLLTWGDLARRFPECLRKSVSREEKSCLKHPLPKVRLHLSRKAS